MTDIHGDKILILDFGAQYTQLIARRIREIGVYCEIWAWDHDPEEIAKFGAKGIILSGGPESTTLPGAPVAPQQVFDSGLPILGICYGMQTLAAQLGGETEAADQREFGHAEVRLLGHDGLLARLWAFWPILELEKGKTYRLHLTSMDYNHGFSLQPVNINLQVHPGYEMVDLFGSGLPDIVEINGKTKTAAQSNESMVAKIVKINVRTTQIQTREGNVLIIPNTHLTQDRIENWSHGSELTRFTIKLAVAYGSDLSLIERLLKQAALAHPKVKKNNQVMVRLADFGDSGLEIELVFWADQSWDINNYKSEIRFEIDRLFRAYSIEIPFPQRMLHQAPQRNS